MKVTWQTEDIKPGQLYSRENITEVWLIGFMSSSTLHSDNHFVAISLDDGMVTKHMTKAAFCEMLNENDYKPVELLNHK